MDRREAYPPFAGKAAYRLAAVLLAAALLIGGIQSSRPLFHLVIELNAVVLLAAVAGLRKYDETGSEARLAIAFLLLVLITPVLQMIPLPPSIWTELSGRELIARIEAISGEGSGWRPLTLDSGATWLGLVSLLPPAAMFLAVLKLGEGQRYRLVLILVAGAALSLAVAFVQLGSPAGAFRLYRGSHDIRPVGLFANRNHQADLLLVAMPFASVLIRHYVKTLFPNRWIIWLIAVLALTAGIVATGSRMGLVLVPVALLGSAVILVVKDRGRSAASSWARRGIVAAMAAVLVGFIALSPAMERTLARFNFVGEGRFDFWPDVVYAAQLYSPWGSGLGTFVPVYRSVEDLGDVSPQYLNHAHNDYLEVWLELGFWGLFLIALFAGLFIWRLLRHQSERMPPVQIAAAAGIFILLVHSVVDYPLRTYALSVSFAFMCALLFPPAHAGAAAGARRAE